MQTMILTPAACRAGLIRHIRVPERYAAVYDCANRLACGFGDVDTEDALQTLPQLLTARNSAGVCGLADTLSLFPLPRFAGASSARCWLYGANPP
jgi:hypothetical protein